MQNPESIYLETREKWREWLAKNHETKAVIWLIYYKKHTGKPSIPYNDAVEEALCYGWIDSTVRRIDEERYMQQFTLRKLRSSWSAWNVRRVEKLIRKGKMTKKGLDLYMYAKDQGLLPDMNQKKNTDIPDIPDFFSEAMKLHPGVQARFNQLARSQRRNYLLWILDAKKEETRNRRVNEAIAILKSGKPLGMK